MKIGQVEKPTFEQFKKQFLVSVYDILGQTPDSDVAWTDLASEEIRERIIKDFLEKMEQQYSIEIALGAPVHNKSGSIEGVVGELYHVFSTMFLIGTINSKIRNRAGL